MNWLVEAGSLMGLLTEDEVFGMDDLGNRTTVNLRSGVDQVYTTATPNLTNRYMEIDSEPLDYDEAGNLTRDHDGYYHVYDYENRVTRIYKMDGQSEVDVAQYVYDALGRKIGKWDAVAGAATFYYHNDNWQILAEYDYMGHLRNFIYGNYIDEPLVMSDQNGDYFYVHDHVYSTVALIGNMDEAWTTVERCEYDAFGTVKIMDASYSPQTVSAFANSYTFTGRNLDILDDGNLRHMHYRHRDYNPELGRFMQYDPLGMNSQRAIETQKTLFEWPVVRQRNESALIRFTDKFEIYEFMSEMEKAYEEAVVFRPELFQVYERNLYNRLSGLLGSDSTATNLNAYTYSIDNPVNVFDPWGLSWWRDVVDWIRNWLPYSQPPVVSEAIAICDGAEDATGIFDNADCRAAFCESLDILDGEYYPRLPNRLPRNRQGQIILPRNGDDGD